MTFIDFAKVTSCSIPTQSQCSVFWDDHWLELDVLYKISIPSKTNRYLSRGQTQLNPGSALPNILKTSHFPVKDFSLCVFVNLILFTFPFHCLKLFLQVNQSWTDCLFHPTSLATVTIRSPSNNIITLKTPKKGIKMLQLILFNVCAILMFCFQ